MYGHALQQGDVTIYTGVVALIKEVESQYVYSSERIRLSSKKVLGQNLRS